jgi:hypothetical protein
MVALYLLSIGIAWMVAPARVEDGTGGSDTGD